jgi:hypothetical protein
MRSYLLMGARRPLHGVNAVLRSRLPEGSGSASLVAILAGHIQGTFYRLKQ